MRREVDEDFEDWEIAPAAQPRRQDYAYDLDAALSAVVSLHARVPEDAFTAETLGVERAGNAVLIDADGVLLTIGYLVTEAESIRLRTAQGQTVAGHVLGYDQASGFGLVQALEPLEIRPLRPGDSRYAQAGDPVVVAGFGGRRRSVAAQVVARQEFAGYWEYLIEEAIFTAPGHPNWGGTALIGADGDLLGIGSLQLQQQVVGGRLRTINMSVPTELLTPVYNDLLTGRVRRARPWLGVYAQELNRNVVIVGVASQGPARRAGLRQGDVIKSVAGMEITNLADFYRSIWALGAPGTEVPMVLERDGDVFDLRVASADRRAFLRSPRLH